MKERLREIPFYGMFLRRKSASQNLPKKKRICSKSAKRCARSPPMGRFRRLRAETFAKQKIKQPPRRLFQTVDQRNGFRQFSQSFRQCAKRISFSQKAARIQRRGALCRKAPKVPEILLRRRFRPQAVKQPFWAFLFGKLCEADLRLRKIP